MTHIASTTKKQNSPWRLALVGLSLGLGLAVLALGLPGSQAALASPRMTEGDAAQQIVSEAHVIVQFGRYDLTVKSITFTAPISGLKALELTGLDVVISHTGFGLAVCSIGGVGCPASNCFCSINSWGYNYWNGQAWQGYTVGAGASVVNDQAIEGWRWGPWTGSVYLYPDLPPGSSLTAAASALEWLLAHQADNGGYGNASGSAETSLSIGANKLRANAWQRQPSIPSLFDHLVQSGPSFANKSADAAGKLAVGLAATGDCWPAEAARPMDFYSSTSGILAQGGGAQAWAMLGAVALSQTLPAPATTYLKSIAQPNGGWEWQPGMGTDTNSTALAVQALVAVGEPITSSFIVSAMAYLKSAQNSDGGFTYNPDSAWGTASDANSTSYAIQAVWAAHQDPMTGTWRISATHPISFLLGLQLQDGSFEWQKGLGSSQLATQQAIVALIGRPLPLAIKALELCPAARHPVYLPAMFKGYQGQ